MAETGLVAERVVAFRCDGASLWGILSQPRSDVRAQQTGILILVGGPQYRVGSHRQFVLLARALARGGYATLRFDYRGMGDSEGDRRNFEAIESDLSVAIDALLTACPTLRRVVVWGLCDAASAALMFATRDPRVAAIVAANPWVRSDASLAAATVKHYYGARLLQAEFWTKLLRGRFDWHASLTSVLANLKGAAALRQERQAAVGDNRFQTAMARGLAGFDGHLLLILSGNDLTAQEFVQYTESDAAWQGVLADAKVARIDIDDADHTFSQRVWSVAAERATLEWLQALDKPAVRVASPPPTQPPTR